MIARGTTWAIVLAGGTGDRFGGAKQYARLGEERLVDLALATVTAVCDGVVLVLPATVAWDGPPVDVIAPAGADRCASVRSGLGRIPQDAEVVVVHQAANPLATTATVRRLIERVRAGAQAAVPGLTPPDVVRRVERGFAVEALGRDELVLVQVPGAFDAATLRAAHASGLPAVEDTALVAGVGGSIAVIDGDPGNIHVTNPTDLQIAACLHATTSEPR
jgi:2-C-methyl-D-erythritol 4-phosphate cytidylyltransferase